MRRTAWRPREGLNERAIRFFREGDIIPVEKINLVRLRSCSLGEKWLRGERLVFWRLAGEA
ncbi:hypothetical protein BN1200_320029 [Klebsiella variicola]|nr:hypothetical protein KLVA_18860 [Klebsiella variicola]GKI78766.1 hypothetical protein NUKP18_05300 [Klebsiella variicola]GKN33567.1 hypothetical protein NUKP84_00110 [Klebsiella variicola]CTQ07889.1 hypothetical protein BN1200_320029 [Klebsiella variicola]